MLSDEIKARMEDKNKPMSIYFIGSLICFFLFWILVMIGLTFGGG